METNGKKKIQITVAGNHFTVLSSEDEEYSRGLAKKVDTSIREMCKNGRISVTAAAILTAVNCCDDLKKANDDIERLKDQLNKYLEDITKQNEKYSELQKENAKLRADIDTYRKRLIEESPGANEDEPLSAAVKPLRRAVAVSESEEAAEDETSHPSETDETTL